jgi:hypothetical protein
VWLISGCRVIKILEGQISFGGMQDALEAIARHKNVKHGLLRVTSNSCSGLMGIFCGRFITGAVLTLSGNSCLPALKELLRAKDGTFAFLDVTAEPVVELNQSLGVDLQALLASHDFSVDAILGGSESLVELDRPTDNVHLIDTDVDVELPPPPELTPERINQTYQRIVSLSEQQKAQEEASQAQQQQPVTEDYWEPAPEHLRRQQQHAMPKPVEISSIILEQDQRQSLDNIDIPPLHALSSNYTEPADFERGMAPIPAEPKFKSTDEFKRLKGWGARSAVINAVLWVLVFAGMGFAIYQYGPALAEIVGKTIPQQPATEAPAKKPTDSRSTRTR